MKDNRSFTGSGGAAYSSERVIGTREIRTVVAMMRRAFSLSEAKDVIEAAMGDEVVRCGDCGRAYRRGGGVYCSRVLQWGSNDRPAPLPVNPDGFCAWGERREA